MHKDIAKIVKDAEYCGPCSRCEDETMTEDQTATDPDMKAKLPPGVWQDEPDRVEFRHEGYVCLLKRGPYGQWCGYVGVEPAHPWHGKSYSAVPAQVHGGVTYAEACDHELGICHVPRPGEVENLHWLGFDCSHSGDGVPLAAEMRAALACNRMFSFLFNEPDDVGSEDGEYRDVAFARAQTIALAEQAAKAWNRGFQVGKAAFEALHGGGV